MKLRVFGLVFLAVLLAVSGCSTIRGGKGVVRVGLRTDGAIGSCVPSKCRWYDDHSLLVSFRESGETSRLKLVAYYLTTKSGTVIYDGVFQFGREEQLPVNGESVGCAGLDRVVVLDRATWESAGELRGPRDDTAISCSPDMEYVAFISFSLFIQNTRSGERRWVCNQKADDTSDFISLAWASDNSKLAYITNTYSDVALVDVASLERRVLKGGKDFEYPDGLVHLLSCSFLPNNRDILIQALCETAVPFAVLRGDRNYESDIVYGDGEAMVLAAFDTRILYALDENQSKRNSLICYDYLTGRKDVLCSTTDFIVAGDFSPDGSKVLFVTYLNGAHRFYTRPVPQ